MFPTQGFVIVLIAFLVQLAVFAIAARLRAGCCQALNDQAHFNRADWRLLPPVDCPLLIKVDGRVLRASRTSHIQKPDGDMEYVTTTGRVLVGRFDWTYP